MELQITFHDLFKAPVNSVYKNIRTNEKVYVKEIDGDKLVENETNNLKITSSLLIDKFEFVSLEIVFANLIDYDLDKSNIKIEHELINKKVNKNFLLNDFKIILNELSANFSTNEIQYIFATGKIYIVNPEIEKANNNLVK